MNRWWVLVGFIGLCACSASEASQPAGPDAGGGGGASAAGGSAGGGSGGGAAASGTGGGAGGSGTGGAGGTIEPDASQRAACRYYLDAACSRRVECSGALDLGCAPLKELCPDYFFSPGSTRTVAILVSCAAEWASFDCGPVNNGGNPACATKGTRQAGEECLFASQCASLRCSGDLYNGICGSCLPDVAVGSTCTASSDCGLAQNCVAGRCAAAPSQPAPPAPAAAGAPCTGSCVAGYACVAAAGSSERRCEPLPGPGSACVSGSNTCRADAYCSSTRQCVAVPAEGAPCGYDYYGGARCAAGTACNRDTNPNGVCTARRALGTSCRVAYSECIEGSECIRDPATSAYICMRSREEGQTCTDPYDHCALATACTGGRCVASGELGLFVKACGP